MLILLAFAGGGIVMFPKLLPLGFGLIEPDIIFAIKSEEKDFYITIDDAPSKNSKLILDVLDKHGVEATFFITGSRVGTKEEIESIKERGHSLGNHLFSTKACSTLNFPEFKESFNACNSIIGETKLFRPPSDFGNKEQIEYVKKEGFEVIMGTVFPLDHWITNPDRLVAITEWLAIDGGILILHDGNECGKITAEVLDRIIPELKAKGYRFKSLTKQITTK